MHMHERKSRGFTLIELMVVVAIVAILAAVAIPGYRNYVLRAGRTDALVAVNEVAMAQERYRLDHNAYATSLDVLNANGMTVNGSGASAYAIPEGGRHTIHLMGATATSFTVEARNYGTQSDDTRCNYFRLTNAGVRSMGVGAVADCWK